MSPADDRMTDQEMSGFISALGGGKGDQSTPIGDDQIGVSQPLPTKNEQVACKLMIQPILRIPPRPSPQNKTYSGK